jgi:competence protein ComEA
MMESMKRLVIASIPLLFLAAARAQDLADGPGKDTFVKICSACHDAAVVVTMHNSKDDWQATVDDMKGRGAEGSDDDFKAIIGYLAKYQGPEVNVNKATAKDLETQLEITTSEATAIVKYRQDKGDFKEWADLQKVAALDIKKIEPLKGRITF